MNQVFRHIPEQKLTEAAELLHELGKKYRIFLFYGEQGSGKTTFIRHLIGTFYGNCPEFCSPTYTLVNEYSVNGKRIYHMDLYRVQHAAELEEAGVSEIITDEGSVCFIEWPEAGRYLWDSILHLAFHLRRDEEKGLTVEVTAHDC